MANPRIIDRYFSWTLWGAFSRRRLLVTGDIADQDTDAVVTAAHWRLNKGAGTDGTIHTKGGPKIYEECRKIEVDVPIGDAVITTGGNLKARHVIHAVESKPPIRQTGNEEWAQFREEWLKDIEPLQLSAIGPSLLATPCCTGI